MKTATKPKPIIFRPSPEMRARIEKFKVESGMPFNEIVKRALAEYVATRNGPANAGR